MSDFFISYQHNSKVFAVQLLDKLGEADINCWMDTKLKTGDEWKPAIDAALKRCIGVIVVVTIDALRSQYVTYEWSFALGLGKRIIPVILEKPDERNKKHPKIHQKLADLHHKYFTDPDIQPWDELIEELRTLINKEYVSPEIQDAERDLRGHEVSKRKEAINYLYGIPKEIALDIFARVIKETQSQDVAVDVGLALAQSSNYKDERAINGLARGIEKHQKQNEVLNALATYNSAEAVQCLVDVLRKIKDDENDRHNRLDIIKSMSRMTHPNVIPELCDIVLHSNSIPWEVIDTLGRLGDPQALPALVSYVSLPERNFESKQRGYKAIAQIPGEESVENLYEILDQIIVNSKHNDQQYLIGEIINALESSTNLFAVTVLQRMASESRFSEIRSTIYYSINNLNNKLNASQK